MSMNDVFGKYHQYFATHTALLTISCLPGGIYKLTFTSRRWIMVHVLTLSCPSDQTRLRMHTSITQVTQDLTCDEAIMTLFSSHQPEAPMAIKLGHTTNTVGLVLQKAT